MRTRTIREKERGADCAAAPPNAEQLPVGNPPHVTLTVAVDRSGLNSADY